MSHAHLGIYLNDHLAGSQGALDLMQRLIEVEEHNWLNDTMAAVRAEVLEERQQLEALMHRLEIEPSRSRQVTGWLGEKVAQIKLRVDDPSDGDLRLFESLE
ncbi:MAG TPA: hypothetical protein VFX76_17075, partial [Roseiflexaceae bacterium]|nr:hypothetical protein [Roseiflexaceae bacterium]